MQWQFQSKVFSTIRLYGVLPFVDKICPGDEFGCKKDGEYKCMARSWFCDGEMDCDDNSDEITCVTPRGTCERCQGLCNV